MPAKTKKSASREKARKTGRVIEAGAVEISRKIWLAGIGAYGMAFSVARSGATVVNEQSAEMFEDLVKRGSDIESEVLERIEDNPAVSVATRQVQKVVSTSQKIQEQVRDRFDTRMERMRSILGVGREGSTFDKLANRLDKLEDDVVGVATTAQKRGNEMLKKRLARLSDEIDHYVGDVEEDQPTKAKKVKPATKKTAPKATKKAPAEKRVADDLTKISGLGPAMAKKLATKGITSFKQLSTLKKAEAVALDEELGARGRVTRDEWVKQAKQLAKG